MRLTRKEFIEKLRKEGQNIAYEELKELIAYYEELLDEQEIGNDDFVPENYDYKKIINDYRLSRAYSEVKNEKKTGFIKSISLITLSIISMPVLFIFLLFVAPFLLVVPIILFVIIITALALLAGSFSLIWNLGTSSAFLFILGIFLIIFSSIYLLVVSLISIIKYLGKKLSDIAFKNKKFNYTKK